VVVVAASRARRPPSKVALSHKRGARNGAFT
jgi:hypothetical protein